MHTLVGKFSQKEFLTISLVLWTAANHLDMKRTTTTHFGR